MPTADAVDVASQQWADSCPDLDVTPGEVLARIQRLAHLIEETQTQRLRRRKGMNINNLGDFDVLRALRRVGPPYSLTPSQLKQAMLVSGAGLSGRLKRLENDGWITRSASPDDGRSFFVKLTPEGLTDLDYDLAEHYAFESTLLQSLDSHKRSQATDILRTLLLDFERQYR